MFYDTEILSLIAPLDATTAAQVLSSGAASSALLLAGLFTLPYAVVGLLDLIEGIRAARRRQPCTCKFLKAACHGLLMLKTLL